MLLEFGPQAGKPSEEGLAAMVEGIPEMRQAVSHLFQVVILPEGERLLVPPCGHFTDGTSEPEGGSGDSVRKRDSLQAREQNDHEENRPDREGGREDAALDLGVQRRGREQIHEFGYRVDDREYHDGTIGEEKEHRCAAKGELKTRLDENLSPEAEFLRHGTQS